MTSMAFVCDGGASRSHPTTGFEGWEQVGRGPVGSVDYLPRLIAADDGADCESIAPVVYSATDVAREHRDGTFRISAPDRISSDRLRSVPAQHDEVSQRVTELEQVTTG